jgi:hypothetical protein
MPELKTVKLDDIEYVRADAVQSEVVIFTGEESVASRMIGKPVLVRSHNEGINAGIVVLADDTGVELKDCRRIWYHKPKDSSLAWYEGVAVSGLHKDSKVSGTVSQKVIIEDYSMTRCEDSAYKSIMEHPNVKS